MNFWFTSDTHFCHIKEFLWKPRGFSSVDEMNEILVERWNNVVPKDWDTIVYHLGDMCLTDTDAAIPYIKRLNGKIIWIRGNHDSDNKVKTILQECPNVTLISQNMYNAWAYVLQDGKRRFYLCHYPTIVNNKKDKPVYCLCGHSHTTDTWADWDKMCYHVELDAHNCYPISFDQIKAEIQVKKMETNI